MNHLSISYTSQWFDETLDDKIGKALNGVAERTGSGSGMGSRDLSFQFKPENLKKVKTKVTQLKKKLKIRYSLDVNPNSVEIGTVCLKTISGKINIKVPIVDIVKVRSRKDNSCTVVDCNDNISETFLSYLQPLF